MPEVTVPVMGTLMKPRFLMHLSGSLYHVHFKAYRKICSPMVDGQRSIAHLNLRSVKSPLSAYRKRCSAALK